MELNQGDQNHKIRFTQELNKIKKRDLYFYRLSKLDLAKIFRMLTWSQSHLFLLSNLGSHQIYFCIQTQAEWVGRGEV